MRCWWWTNVYKHVRNNWMIKPPARSDGNKYVRELLSRMFHLHQTYFIHHPLHPSAEQHAVSGGAWFVMMQQLNSKLPSSWQIRGWSEVSFDLLTRLQQQQNYQTMSMKPNKREQKRQERIIYMSNWKPSKRRWLETVAACLQKLLRTTDDPRIEARAQRSNKQQPLAMAV